MAERDVSIFDIEHYKIHIKEEIADVLVVLKQFKEYYDLNLDDIKEIINNKVNRQLKRMEEE